MPTVPVGTADRIRRAMESQGLKSGVDFDVVSNPEFLREGFAVTDFMKPDRIVIGADNDMAFETMRDLYAPFTHNHDRMIEMDIRSAEMTNDFSLSKQFSQE